MDARESPDIVYGRMLESAHVSGYTFERLCDGLERLLEGDAWKQVGQGYDDINDFLRSIDLSSFNLGEHRASLHQRIKELQPGANNCAIADMTGSSESTVRRDTRTSSNDEVPASDPQEAQGVICVDSSNDEMASDDPVPPPLPSRPYSDRFERWLRRLSDEALYIDHPREGGGLGGLPAMLAEREKWDWRLMREHVLPMLDSLGRTIARYKQEIEKHASAKGRSQGMAGTR